MSRHESTARITPQVETTRLDQLFDLAGVRVFIPGGYGALGEAIARGFAHHGAAVAIAGPSGEKAKHLADDIASTGVTAIGMQLDARKPSEIDAVVGKVASELGGIDVLVNCVGIQKEQKLLDVTEDVFDGIYETNLKSAMFLAQSVARRQIDAGNGGRHIHLLSVRSKLALRERGYSAYCATKGGLLMLVKQHAMELAPHNITVNGVAPTFIQSDRIRPHLERGEFHDFILKRNPLGRIGDPIEVVGQVITFAANAGAYITGQVVYVDGGVTASQ
ncbi:MAG: SDR family NAD(P)-dependent oxidoreductase [Hyphomicrobiales bacterium]